MATGAVGEDPHHRRKWVNQWFPAGRARRETLGRQASVDGAAGGGQAGVQVGSERRHRADNHDGDAGDDQSVLDGGGAGLVFENANGELTQLWLLATSQCGAFGRAAPRPDCDNLTLKL
jgi:hypothetical protein